MPFDTYIDDKDVIDILMDHDWIVMNHGTWTNCPFETYKALEKQYRHNGNAVPYIEGEMS